MLGAKRNQVKGLYYSGRPTDIHTRTKVLDMYLQGQTFSEISKTTGLTTRGAKKICKQYENTGSLAPTQQAGGARSILINNLVERIEYYKMCKPSIYNKEIREKLFQKKYV